MGGDRNGDTGHAKAKKPADEKDVNEWLQAVIDILASEYGWNKEQIFSMFPAEVEILMDRIRTRNEAKTDAELIRMIIAARTPHTKDQGQAIINTIMAKQKVDPDGEVTEESIRREMAIARSLLQR